MKCQEFFNLFPEECLILKYRFGVSKKTEEEIGEATEWGVEEVRFNESQALFKIVTALHNLGIVINKGDLRCMLDKGIIVLDGIMDTKKRKEEDERIF